MKVQELSYKELVARATEHGFEKANQTKKDALIEFLLGVKMTKRPKKEADPRILEMAGGNYTRREIAKALNLKYSDVYFALKKAGLDAKPVKKAK
jgi:DNA invertase Pin-like site-specific DNA recombinase